MHLFYYLSPVPLLSVREGCFITALTPSVFTRQTGGILNMVKTRVKNKVLEGKWDSLSLNRQKK